MSVTIDKIDLLRERTNISYSEAQEILEKFDGNVVEALISLENNNKTLKVSNINNNTNSNYQYQQKQHKQRHYQQRQDYSRHKDTAMKWLKKLHTTYLAISKRGSSIINLPLTIAIPLILFTLPFSVFVLIGVAITGHSISIKRNNGINFTIDEVMDITKDSNNQTSNQQHQYNNNNNNQQ
ncbi:hypothetical protein IMX26_12290 [Clostridium sp. 'deep sea']|uniref:hypothetical protein n=1 Tax=Clostridium sp. 'deep sea' TaxID=2779445 RepID=UPI001896815F|nr:hypothetical protein [Clostridium sp. 'deep sea']QOR34266.1 hypothetical protein IMX26_12290 [Clostridium sp. 'deep sea']